jgi:hypothetical protein
MFKDCVVVFPAGSITDLGKKARKKCTGAMTGASKYLLYALPADAMIELAMAS